MWSESCGQDNATRPPHPILFPPRENGKTLRGGNVKWRLNRYREASHEMSREVGELPRQREQLA